MSLCVYISIPCKLLMFIDYVYLRIYRIYISSLYMYLSIVISLRSDSDFNKEALTYLVSLNC